MYIYVYMCVYIYIYIYTHIYIYIYICIHINVRVHSGRDAAEHLQQHMFACVARGSVQKVCVARLALV
jgi:hypothetical protein